LARTLVDWIRVNGGEVIYRQKVEKIETGRGQQVFVHTRRGLSLTADTVVANLTPWALCDLLGPDAPPTLRRDVAGLRPTWGAFTLYLGLDATALPPGLPNHHQVIVDASQPLGEGNSIFLSLSPADDEERAPMGMRAATLSTHTDVAPWWRLRNEPDESAYQAQRDDFTERLLVAAERAVPGLRRAVRLCLPGTPVTFQHYTGRPLGMVGGFAQTSLYAARGPRTGLPNVWLVGDSIFPGQSTAGVTLGAMRVAAEVATSGSV
jgi:phytoene dehydrogenase-like protein